VVYFPSGGEVQVDVTAAEGSLDVHWINIDTGELGAEQTINGGRRITLTSPDKANWCAVIVAR